MAHMQKCTKTDVFGLAVHFERREGSILSNKDIDTSRSYLNYNLAATFQPLKPESFVSMRVNEVKHINRKDVIQMVDWVITLPKNVKKDDERKFFEYSLEFISQRYGKQNIVCAWVHKDETTPHIHISFVPVRIVDDIEKLDCKNIMTRNELKTFHPDLGRYLEERLGYLPEIQNDATINGNRSIKELKAQEDLSLKKSLSNVHKHIEASEKVFEETEDLKFETSNLLEKAKTLSKANGIIDELKQSNKQLKHDTKALTRLVEVQKQEINGYRNMPLAKQIKQKENIIDDLHSSMNSLENQIEDYKYDIYRLEKTNINNNNKIEKLENELFIHTSFISLMGLDDVFKKFKKLFINERNELHLSTLIDICKSSIEKINKMFETLISRFDFLEKNGIKDEQDIVYRGEPMKQIERGER